MSGRGLHEEDETASRLERARRRLADVDARIDDHGEEAVETAAAAYRKADDLLDSYDGRATGTGRETFKAYVQLEGQFGSLVEGLPADLPNRAAFESAWEAIDKRRLNERDFERARNELEPAERFASLVDERSEARETLEEARKAATRRLREIDTAIDERERLLELSSIDFDAPVDRLRDPIERYNDAVREAFTDFRNHESAREVFDLLERSRLYPLVDFERPPDDLRTYVTTNDAGEYTIPELLEYADYSRSKLDHYVDDAGELKRRVATQQTYLEGIDAEPLTVSWPPAEANTLRYRLREYQPFVTRIGGGDLVGLLRAVRALTAEPDYERLRTAAVGTDRLSDEERRRLADGRVEEELESLRAERERLSDVLEDE